MTIPPRLQVFDVKVDLSDKDQERLAPYLTSWVTLSRVLFASINEADCQRLAIMEMLGNRRKHIMDKLLARAGSLARKRIAAKVASAVHLDASDEEDVI